MASDVSILAALVAGIISFLSPCVLPLVPPYLVYLTGATVEHVASGEPGAASRRAVMVAALMFVLGFSTVFVALGAAAYLVKPISRDDLRTALTTVAALPGPPSETDRAPSA